MLDIAELDSSLKLRALGRLVGTRHPFLLLIKNKICLEKFFDPKCNCKADPISNKAVELLKCDRNKL